MGYEELYVGEIYDFNIASQKCFESVGFRKYEKTEKGARYVMKNLEHYGQKRDIRKLLW